MANVLAMKRPPHKVLEIQEGASRDDIDSAWIEKVRKYVPGRAYDGDLDEYNAVMGAYIALTSELSGVRPGPDDMIDWAPYYLVSKWWLIAQTRDGITTLAGHMVDGMAAELEELPKFIPGDRLYGLQDFDVPFLLDGLLGLPEFSTDRNLPRDHNAFQIIWKNGNWRSKGSLIMGTCQAISQKDRDLWAGAGAPPSWRLTLNLPYWTLADSWERKRLLHHEVAHALLDVPESEEGDEQTLPKAKTIPHDMEEFICTAARFGVSQPAHVQLIVAAYNHPETQRAMKENKIEFDERGQGFFKMFHRDIEVARGPARSSG